MVRVYKNGRYYAMKVYSDQYLKEKRNLACSAVELFQRETVILQSIQHPEIPGYIDSFSCENMYCLVQEYISGNTLAEIINQGYCYDEAEVKGIICKLLRILSFLHIPKDEKSSIVHRDLRLSNLIFADNVLFLIDFGLACRGQNSTDLDLLARCSQLRSGGDISSSYLKMRNNFSIQGDLFGAGVVAVDLFTNSVVSDEFIPWEQRIPVSQSFKFFIRRLLGVEGSFGSCIEALNFLRSTN